MKTEYLSFPQHPTGVRLLLRRAKGCPHVVRSSAICTSDENASRTRVQGKEIRVESLLVPGWQRYSPGFGAAIATSRRKLSGLNRSCPLTNVTRAGSAGFQSLK